MKKIFLLIASSVLLLAGCTKESKLSDAVVEGETVTVKVMAQLENAVPATRASWDNDGNGAKVDHWILEVYDAQGMLFDRQEKENQTGLTNSFEVILVKNQTYEFAFWADTKGAYKTDDLHAVAVNYTKVGLDSQDAFFADEDDYVSKKSETVNVTLRRPLAQLNIVSLDFKKIYEQMEKAGTTGDYDKFCPVDLELKGDIYNKFNVLDSTVSDKKSSTFSLDSCYANYMAHKDTTTIYMCYGFAAADKEIYNLGFSFKSNSVPIEYGFNNIPMQRNYRTNIFGNLLSNDSEWNVVIDPVWETPDTNIVPVVSVSLDKSDMTLFVGDDTTLVATALPENATDPSVVWSSSDEKVATVDEDGKVKAVAPGTATITATASDGILTTSPATQSDSCTITVIPVGSLTGVFSVSADKVVRFSKGNLRYTVASEKWSFFDNQYDCGPATYGDGHNAEISLFTWGYGSWSTDPDGDSSELSNSMADWGTAIDDKGTWETLSNDEWKYLLSAEGRGEGDKFFKCGVEVCGKQNCLVIAPDGNNEAIAASYDDTAWSKTQAAGFVCLPVAGYRANDIVYDVGGEGDYWSASSAGSHAAYYVLVDESSVSFKGVARGCGFSVRLVTEVPAE